MVSFLKRRGVFRERKRKRETLSLLGSWNINNGRRRNRGGVPRAPQEEPPKSKVLYCRLIIVNASVKLQRLIPYLVLAGDLSLHFLEVYFWNSLSGLLDKIFYPERVSLNVEGNQRRNWDKRNNPDNIDFASKTSSRLWLSRGLSWKYSRNLELCVGGKELRYLNFDVEQRSRNDIYRTRLRWLYHTQKGVPRIAGSIVSIYR